MAAVTNEQIRKLREMCEKWREGDFNTFKRIVQNALDVLHMPDQDIANADPTIRKTDIRRWLKGHIQPNAAAQRAVVDLICRRAAKTIV